VVVATDSKIDPRARLRVNLAVGGKDDAAVRVRFLLIYILQDELNV
jgi:hypothetical protein